MLLVSQSQNRNWSSDQCSIIIVSMTSLVVTYFDYLYCFNVFTMQKSNVLNSSNEKQPFVELMQNKYEYLLHYSIKFRILTNKICEFLFAYSWSLEQHKHLLHFTRAPHCTIQTNMSVTFPATQLGFVVQGNQYLVSRQPIFH